MDGLSVGSVLLSASLFSSIIEPTWIELRKMAPLILRSYIFNLVLKYIFSSWLHLFRYHWFYCFKTHGFYWCLCFPVFCLGSKFLVARCFIILSACKRTYGAYRLFALPFIYFNWKLKSLFYALNEWIFVVFQLLAWKTGFFIFIMKYATKEWSFFLQIF